MEWRPAGGEQQAMGRVAAWERTWGESTGHMEHSARNRRRWGWGVSIGRNTGTGEGGRQRSCEPQPGACSPGESLGFVLRRARISHPRNSNSVAIDGEEIAKEAGRSEGYGSPDQDLDGRS